MAIDLNKDVGISSDVQSEMNLDMYAKNIWIEQSIGRCNIAF